MDLFCLIALDSGEYREVYRSEEDICFLFYLSANSYPRTVVDALREIEAHPTEAKMDIHRSQRLRYLSSGGYFETFEDIIIFYQHFMRYKITEILW